MEGMKGMIHHREESEGDPRWGQREKCEIL
jgi:hypothetical protein